MNSTLTYSDISRETASIFKAGSYTVDETLYDIKSDLDFCLNNTRAVSSFPELNRRYKKKHCDIRVVQINMLSTALDLKGNTVVANIFKKSNPSGDLLLGSITVEDNLKLRTCLEESQQQIPTFYNFDETDIKGLFMNDTMLYSPKLVVIRDDLLKLKAPKTVNCITCPALLEPSGDLEIQFNMTLEDRIYKILNLAIHTKNDNIVFGPLGCSPFLTDPYKVAEIFKRLLIGEGLLPFFKKVIFAVPMEYNYKAFNHVLYK